MGSTSHPVFGHMSNAELHRELLRASAELRFFNHDIEAIAEELMWRSGRAPSGGRWECRKCAMVNSVGARTCACGHERNLSDTTVPDPSPTLAR